MILTGPFFEPLKEAFEYFEEVSASINDAINRRFEDLLAEHLPL
jgi:hypothetical protein